MSALVLRDFVDGADIGMVQARGRARLVLKPRDQGAVTRKARRDQLQRHGPTERQIVGLVHDRRRPVAELFEYAVVRYRRAYHVRPGAAAGLCAGMPDAVSAPGRRDCRWV